MELISKSFKETDELSHYLRENKPTFFHASKTSTVIPYEKLSEHLESIGIKQFTLGNLSTLPAKMELDSNNHLIIRGGVTWKEAREFCQAKGRQIMTSPTEELASILSGVATSCTGERCFGFGTLREQLVQVSYLDFEGRLNTLSSEGRLKNHHFFKTPQARKVLEEYQEQYKSYLAFKNAPFPRMEVETDLMTGTEGQLGIVVEGVLKTAPANDVNYIFLALPKWEESSKLHLHVFNAVQPLRDKVLACELIDENSWSYLEKEDIPRPGKDIIFLEIKSAFFEEVYESVLLKLSEYLEEEDIFEVPENRCRELRMKIPRCIFEANTRMGVTKKGTDVQVRADDFAALLDFYSKLTKVGIGYNLFGHFGDAHLHFNFMPTPAQQMNCQQHLQELYDWVLEVKGSPFAEHGIGLTKLPFIRPFYSSIQKDLFSYLKTQMDPHSQFFPEGFMLKGLNQ